MYKIIKFFGVNILKLQHSSYFLLLLLLCFTNTINGSTRGEANSKSMKFIKPINNENGNYFQPIMPSRLTLNYRTDLTENKNYTENNLKIKEETLPNSNLSEIEETNFAKKNDKINSVNKTLLNENTDTKGNDEKLSEIEIILLDYVDKSLNNDSYEIISGVKIEREKTPIVISRTSRLIKYEKSNLKENALLEQSRSANDESLTFDEQILDRFKQFAETHVVKVNMGRAVESGRLFFFKGLKKILWPIMIGVQIAKTILLALFLPSILGSLGKIVGKGLTSVSGFTQPSETVDDLEFKDNAFNSDQDIYGTNEYSYPPASDTNSLSQMYEAAATNNVPVSRYGAGGQKVTYINTPSTNYYSKNTNSLMPTKQNDFKLFHDIPQSSMLLTNYDPFYSPLLSRLDAVYQQFGLTSGDEKCREKLVCLMYASPAKYAPYSNLISAQLSRELNELKKPTTDNPDVLRFFKYMKAAKDGQDGIACDAVYRDCTKLKENKNPAMISTFNDINKLVQARKIRK